MDKELIHRILTSIVILPILFISIFKSGVFLLTLLTFIYLLSFYEIIKNTNNLLFILFSNILLISAIFSFYNLRGNTDYSLVILLWILSTTFLSDIGGYVFGKIFKGKKLSRISPNKTYSGSIGSIFLSIFSLPIINLFQENFFSKLFVDLYEIKYFFLTIFISVICQFGDLYVSYWKRKIKIKNISNFLPGHGGILDRIDGLIFVLIITFFLKKAGLI
jgi:phosphatidate cytidylyltransferase